MDWEKFRWMVKSKTSNKRSGMQMGARLSVEHLHTSRHFPRPLLIISRLLMVLLLSNRIFEKKSVTKLEWHHAMVWQIGNSCHNSKCLRKSPQTATITTWFAVWRGNGRGFTITGTYWLPLVAIFKKF